MGLNSPAGSNPALPAFNYYNETMEDRHLTDVAAVKAILTLSENKVSDYKLTLLKHCYCMYCNKVINHIEFKIKKDRILAISENCGCPDARLGWHTIFKLEGGY